MGYGKKGQISLFVILGIFLLFLGAISYYFYTSSSERSLDEQQRKIMESSIDSIATSVFVDDCINSGLRKGIIELGKYGGLIAPNENFVNLNDEFYRLLIYFDDNNYADYPCKEDSRCKYPYVNEEDYNIGEYSLDLSVINNQLKIYLGNYAKQCINFSDILGLFGDDFRIDIGDYDSGKSNVLIGDDKISAVVHFPIYIVVGNEPVKGILKFSGEVDVSLFKLVKMIGDELYLNTKNISHQIDNSILNKLSVGSYMDVIKIDNNPYSFIHINNMSTTLPNFVFRFALENRPPIINYVSINSSEGYDILMIENDSLSFFLNVSDPENDNFSLNFNCDDCDYSWNNNVITIDNVSLGYHEVNFTANDSIYSDISYKTILVDKKMNTSFSFVWYGKNEDFILSGKDLVINITSPKSEYNNIKYRYNITIGTKTITKTFSSEHLLENPRIINFTNPNVYSGKINITLHEYWDYGNHTRYMNVTKEFDVVSCHINDPCCKGDSLSDYTTWKLSSKNEKCFPIELVDCNSDVSFCTNGLYYQNCSVGYCDGISAGCNGDVKWNVETDGLCNKSKCSDNVDSSCDGIEPGSYLSEKNQFCFPCSLKDKIAYKGSDLNNDYKNNLIRNLNNFYLWNNAMCGVNNFCHNGSGEFTYKLKQVRGWTGTSCKCE